MSTTIAPPRTGKPKQPRPKPERLTYRIGEIAEMLGIHRRTLERMRSSGEFPPPDRLIGKRPMWTRETVLSWIGKK